MRASSMRRPKRAHPGGSRPAPPADAPVAPISDAISDAISDTISDRARASPSCTKSEDQRIAAPRAAAVSDAAESRRPLHAAPALPPPLHLPETPNDDAPGPTSGRSRFDAFAREVESRARDLETRLQLAEATLARLTAERDAAAQARPRADHQLESAPAVGGPPPAAPTPRSHTPQLLRVAPDTLAPDALAPDILP